MAIELYTGLAPQTLICQEGGTSGSYENGDLVKTDSSGQIVLATAGTVLGIARKKYTGTQATELDVEVINFSDIYSMPYSTTTAQNLVGLAKDLVFTAGAQTVTSTNTYKEVTIVGLDPRDAVGTSGGRVLIKFNPAASASGALAAR